MHLKFGGSRPKWSHSVQFTAEKTEKLRNSQLSRIKGSQIMVDSVYDCQLSAQGI